MQNKNLLNNVEAEWIENPLYNGNLSEFVKTFNVNKKPESAILKIVGLGAYLSKINNELTDEFYYKPLLTDFDVRIHKNNKYYDENNYKNSTKSIIYDVFDVSDKIKVGNNTLSVILGDGWYANTDRDYNEPTFSYGTPTLFFELSLDIDDKIIEIVSDESCLTRTLPQRSTVYKSDFKDFTAKPSKFINATICSSSPKGEMRTSTAERDGIIDKFDGKLIKSENNRKIFDFGTNHSGGVVLKIKGKKGSKLTIGHFEVLDKDGNPNYMTSRWSGYNDNGEVVTVMDQIAEYVLSGDEDEISPLFHWDCYRYIELNCNSEYEIISLNSLFIASTIKKNGDFECSNDIFNRLYKAFITTQRANMHCGVPTDCPHREKLPYTGDGQCTAKSVFYSFDFENFYNKWLTDIIDSQGENGFIPYSAPALGGGGGCWWSNALVELPFYMYYFTGDINLIKKAYNPTKKLLDFYFTMCNGDYIVVKSKEKWLLGDWIAPETVISSNSFINTIAYFVAAEKYKKMSQLLDNREEEKWADCLAGKIKNAINKTFFDEKTINYSHGVQGENAIALYYGIVPEKYKNLLFNKLADEYDKSGHIDTGMVITPLLINLLTKNKRCDVAYKLMDCKDYPSFAFMLKDETTLCEHWSKYWPTYSPDNGKTIVPGGGDVSHCHPVLGAVVYWLNESVGGLNLSNLYKKQIVYSPKFIDYVDYAKSSNQTKFGLASIEYHNKDTFTMAITIPKNVEGVIELNEGKYVAKNGNDIVEFNRNITLNDGCWIIIKQ
ncbi:MAG: family 78 glycoside hydrolase catalytic domain [Clostridia bacterium]|nr:family 78 glycoside hydrolase catalytic domain [Clostridia bacterium]MBR0189980.1 family 78 glycoside hydrolase catalytic domain [Clostridia bacterium]